MMKAKPFVVGGVVAAAVCVPMAWGAGLFATLPIIGGRAYCAATIVQGSSQTGITGTMGQPAPPFPVPGVFEGFPGTPPGFNPVVCQSSVPPGPATFSGTENAPFDVYPPGAQIMAGGAQTALIKVTQLGQGALLDLNTAPTPAGNPVLLPASTGFAVLDTGLGATATIDLPNPAIDGEIVSLVCNGGGSTSLTVQTASPTATAPAPTGPQTQTIVPTPTAGACAAGTVSRYRFVAEATGTLVADTWLKIQ